jgi:tetratricopeptide (TPR) repeat protein
MIQADARNYVLAQTKTDKKYDVITAEPSNPWMAGNSNLFTREQFELYEQILDEDDGVICQWIHYYSMSLNDLKTVLATFTGVFPNTTLWRTGGDLLMIATKGEQSIDFTALKARLQQEDVLADLKRMDVNAVYDVLGRFVMGPTALAEYYEDAPIHTDNHPILQFSAPKSLHSDTVLDNAWSLQSSAQRIEDVDSLLINYEDEVNFSEEIQKQIGFYIHYTNVIYNENHAVINQQKALISQQKKLISQQKAQDSQEKGDYAAAIEYANEAAEYANEEAHYINVAFEYASDALASYEASLGTGARDAYAHRRLGEILKKRFLEGGMDPVDLDQALTHLEQSVALNPSHAPTWVDLGGIYLVMAQLQQDLYKEHIQEAIDSYSNAINLAEDNSFLYNLRGQAKLWIEDYNGAIVDFNQVIRLQPAFDEAWFSRARAYLELALDAEDEAEKTAELDKALSDANRALHLDPKQPMPYYVRGRVYYEWGEQTGNRQYYSRAVEEQNKAIAINFNLPYSHLSLGMAYAALGGMDNYSEARSEMTTATSLNDKYAEAWYELGRFEPRMAEYFPDTDWIESAIKRFAKIYDIDPAPDSEIMQNALDALDELMDWDNLTEVDLTHLGLIYQAVPDTDVSEKIPDAIDAIMDWDNITEDDRASLATIINYMPNTNVGQKAQDAIDVLGPVS